MKKVLIFLLVILLSMNLINGSLIISPNPLEISTKLNEASSHNLTITNNYNFTIMSFEFTNLTGFTFPTITINANETKTIDFTVKRNDLVSQNILSEVSFKYLVEIPEQPITHEINMTSTGFKPDFITIHVGDTIIWKNKDTVSHTVTSYFFDYDLQVNGTSQYTFTTPETVNYDDLTLFWSGQIRVLSRDENQQVNNPNYDELLRVNLDVISDPTNLSINIPETEFEVDAVGSKEGLVTIKNTGDEVAQKISLESSNNWIFFSKDNFNLERDDTSYITFRIQPLLFSSNETNKTYDIEITIKALNSEPYNETIKVFIPYSDVFDDFGTEEGYLTWFTDVYCPANPNVFWCNTSVSQQQQKVIIRDPEIPINLSATEFYASLKRQQRTEDAIQRLTTRNDQLSDFVEKELKLQTTLNNESLELSKKSYNNGKSLEWILGSLIICFIFIVLFKFTWNPVKQIIKQNHLMGRTK